MSETPTPAPTPAAPTPTDRVREILERAMQRPIAGRAAFVMEAAAGDARVSDEVISLLAALERAGDVLEPPRAATSEPEPAEPLTGLTFGPYVVGDRIGEGGMGVVYAARDTRLARTVAVKALPPVLARDPDRRARLEHEARILASLNHPNIAAIFGVEVTPRGPVMILEYVPGRTLAQELASRRFSVEESVAIACQIALGLESAHSCGVVHRDLKPANIKITPDGLVKILDLGVAKFTPHAGSKPESDSAVTMTLTQPGMLVGTAAYMSPEQARGRPVDRRTDLWTLGCVLYEMLTATRAFDGDTPSDAIAEVLRSDPDWSRLPGDTPQGVRRVLARCLSKDPDLRMRDAGDAILDLRDDQGPPRVSSPGRRGRWTLVGTAAVLLAAGAGGAWLLRPSGTTHEREVRFTIAAAAPISITAGSCLAFSPDGRDLVYAAAERQDASQLYLRHMDTFATEPIAGTLHAFSPFFSPDGRWIGYTDNPYASPTSLRRIPVDGGPIQTIAAFPGLGFGASWGDDGTIVFSAAPGVLWRVPATGGTPVAVGTAPDNAWELHSQPEVLPGSRAALFTCWRFDGKTFRPRIEAIEIKSGERRIVVATGSQARFARDTGMLTFNQAGLLMAAALDVSGPSLAGPPRRVIGLEAADSDAYARYDVSDSGTLAFVPGNTLWSDTDLAWFGTDGSSTTVYRGFTAISTLRLSPDGKRVAFSTAPPESDLWVLDLERGAPIRLTTTGGTFFPVWTPDGTRLVYQHIAENGKSEVLSMLVDGRGGVELVHRQASGIPCFPTGFSPDGRLLLVSADTKGTDTDIFLVRMDADRTCTKVFDTSADRVAARFSPDGKLIAYCSSETGRPEIYIHAFPALDHKAVVSTGGGERPTWSGDGKRLFYRYLGTIYAVDITTTPQIAIGKPEIVLEKLPGMRYDPSPDATRFIMGRPRGEWTPQTSINVVTGAVKGGGR